MSTATTVVNCPTMSKPATLAELKTALAPLFDEMTRSTAQSSETHTLLLQLLTRIEALEHLNIEDDQPKAIKATRSKTTKKSTKLPPKKGAKPEESEEESEEETKAKVKKAPVKRKRTINKTDYFNMMFDNDPEYFANYIPDEVKEEVIESKPTLKGEALHKEIRKESYKYMTAHHDSTLQTMKESYIQEQKNNGIVLAEADD